MGLFRLVQQHSTENFILIMKLFIRSSQFVHHRLSLSRWTQLSHRYVATLSPLATRFNEKPSSSSFSFMPKKGLFGYPELTHYTGFYALEEHVESEISRLIKEALSGNRKRKMIAILDEMSNTLCKTADMAQFVSVSHPDSKYRQAAEHANLRVNALVEELNTNAEFYNAVKEVSLNGDVSTTTEVDNRVLDLLKIDFEQCGIHLEEDKRKEYLKYNNSILQVGAEFMLDTSEPNLVSKDCIPEHMRSFFHQERSRGDYYIFGAQWKHFDPKVREIDYKYFNAPSDNQDKLLTALLEQRHLQAVSVGYPTYAHRAVENTMVDTPEAVVSFLQSISDKIKDRAAIDYSVMKYMGETVQASRQITQSKEIMPWDPPYYSSLANWVLCHLDVIGLSEYFSLGVCMEGLNKLFKSLYNVELRYENPDPAEVWHPSVHKLSVYHGDDGFLGTIYCDFFEREGRQNADCHHNIIAGRENGDGSYQHPKLVLMLTLPSPSHNTPSLLLPSMVETLFHEFGHAMHSILGRTKYQHVAGTRCPTDFAEIPSTLMEFFASDPRVITSFAKHYKTGEALPKEMVEKLCLSKTLFKASSLQQQVFKCMLDQVYHGKHPLGKSTTEVLADVQNKYYGIPYVPNTAMQLRFGHLFSYGAKYHAYLISQAVSSRIWDRCFKQDPFSREMGEKFRREILAHGFQKDPWDMVQGMLDERPSLDQLVQTLIDSTVDMNEVLVLQKPT